MTMQLQSSCESGNGKPRTRRSIRYAVASLVGVAVIVAAVVMTLATLRTGGSEHIQIVIPVGFQGRFEIVQDSVNGLDPKRTDSAITYEIPSTGRLHVRSLEPFRVYRTYVFSRSDGTSCTAELLGSRASFEEVVPGKEWRGSGDRDGAAVEFRTLP